MLVYGSGKYARCYEGYLGYLIGAHLVATLVVSALLMVFAVLGRIWLPGGLTNATIGLAVAAPLSLLLWLLRRAFYPRFQPHWGAVGSFAYVVLTLGAIFWLQAVGRLTPFSAMITLGVAAVPPAIGLMLLLRPANPWALSLAEREEVRSDHWSYGRWSLGTAGLMWLPGNLYYAALPLWAGLEATAALRAIVNLLTPILRGNSALAVLLVPAFVRAQKSRGGEGFAREASRLLALFIAAAVAYGLILIFLGEDLLALLYGGRYGEYARLLLPATLLPLASAVIAVLGSALRARERPDLVFRSYLASSLVTLTGGLGLTAVAGVVGGVWGLIISWWVAAVVMYRYHVARSQ